MNSAEIIKPHFRWHSKGYNSWKAEKFNCCESHIRLCIAGIELLIIELDFFKNKFTRALELNGILALLGFVWRLEVSWGFEYSRIVKTGPGARFISQYQLGPVKLVRVSSQRLDTIDLYLIRWRLFSIPIYWDLEEDRDVQSLVDALGISG